MKAVPSPKIWRAIQGSTLKDTLYSWDAEEKCIGGQSGNWSVAWLADVNYRIDAPLSFSGSFKDALNGVFRLYTTAAVPLYAGISTSQCLLKGDAKEVRYWLLSMFLALFLFTSDMTHRDANQASENAVSENLQRARQTASI
ncbi:toxin co-regulated pilus biosynthesis Q family protein [Enterobacter bugandensis]|uniref:Toxin co-regulated pilus biosynthesis Q family protein n=1 Tax=Enterobacter bugandensis TaxID=881260 RepID=A0AA42TQI3_9ENTR|nr:toxin co-regulated pilus biosynthesis Q family protein [Enterobacter bugandensis]MDH1321570.1 toxin co-regulated pilus biosynthesis Q family protein [Enterobacter bugandensis]